MKVAGNTVLITGGASGIGLALAKRFLERGNEVIICGRRADRLEEARMEFPGLHVRVADVSTADGRAALAVWAGNHFPSLNVLVNNAGIQRSIDLTKGEEWDATRSEIATNLEAPIHLSQILLPQLKAHARSAIINVTSGLSFSPLASAPVYSATKAALHSFTLSLRHQLGGTPVEVIEVIPPAVDTDLQAPGLHTFGVKVDEFADAVFRGLEEGSQEIAYGTADLASGASRPQLDTIFERMNASAH